MFNKEIKTSPRVYSYTEAGGHLQNEDYCEFHEHPTDSNIIICTLADGQGGRAGGAKAARVAGQACLASAIATKPKQLIRPTEWLSILASADRAVATAPDTGFTTLIGLCVSGSFVHGASIGDSAVIVYDKDLTWHRLTDQQVKNPPVGSGYAKITPFSYHLTPPWLIVVMSDGVWSYSGWESVLMHPPNLDGELLIQSLLSRARLSGSGQLQDDFTIITIQSE